MTERHQTTEIHQRPGRPSLKDRWRARRAAQNVIEGALQDSPEVARANTKTKIDRALQLASGRQIAAPEADASPDLRTVSHQSRTHEHVIRTLTIPGDKVGLPEDERVGLYATTSPDSPGVASGTFDWGDDQVYLARYPADGDAQLELLTPDGLANMDDQDLSRLRDVANGVLAREDEERSRVTAGYLTGLPGM